jgi:hypothetical protein
MENVNIIEKAATIMSNIYSNSLPTLDTSQTSIFEGVKVILSF